MTASIKNQTPQPHMNTKDQKRKANPRTTKKAVAPKNIAPPLRKRASIIRNDYNNEHVVARKAWHAEICNYNIPAADTLSILIDLYDESPDMVTDGELYMDDCHFDYCLLNDPHGEHGYGAILKYLESLGLISFRRCYDTKFQHAASGRMYHIRLEVSEIEQWLEEDGWEVPAQTL